MALSQLLANFSPPLLKLQERLLKGEVDQLLQRAPRADAEGPRMLRLVDSELLTQLVEGYKSGLTVYDLASQHGIHRTTVAQHLRDAGLVLRRTVTAGERQRMKDLYNLGLTPHGIGKMVKRDPQTVINALQKMNAGS